MDEEPANMTEKLGCKAKIQQERWNCSKQIQTETMRKVMELFWFQSVALWKKNVAVYITQRCDKA